ncbi:hypothetical protein DFJ74DRAFT_606172 [Hyaloraphidium curvatum]|nr:hypothetical protein DFJ74DRAFT_606172 [Hyaloraphidium curvatum]
MNGPEPPDGGSAGAGTPSSSAARRPAAVSVRILCIDHYLAPPDARFQGDAVGGRGGVYSEFAPTGTPLRCVPVLRVYGLTPVGQKCLVHVHNVFPYFYIPYEGPQPLARQPGDPGGDGEEVDEDLLTEDCRLYIYRLGASIERALSAFLNRDPNDPIRSQHVHSIFLVKGIKFYGFHAGYSFFLKIHFLDPGLTSKCEKLMQQGAVLGRTFDTFESHFPYSLQFMLDHNLYGMDMLHVAEARFRRPGVLNADRARDPAAFYTDATLPAAWLWPADGPPRPPQRQSELDLEFDVWAMDICNRDAVSEKPDEALIDLLGPRKDLVHPMKHVPSVDAVWEDERERRRRAGMDPDEIDKAVEKENRVPRDNVETEPDGRRKPKWGGEEELWKEIEAIPAAVEELELDFLDVDADADRPENEDELEDLEEELFGEDARGEPELDADIGEGEHGDGPEDPDWDFVAEHYSSVFSYAPTPNGGNGADRPDPEPPPDSDEEVSGDSQEGNVDGWKIRLPQYDGPGPEDVEDDDEVDLSNSVAERKSRRMKSISGVVDGIRRGSHGFARASNSQDVVTSHGRGAARKKARTDAGSGAGSGSVLHSTAAGGLGLDTGTQPMDLDGPQLEEGPVSSRSQDIPIEVPIDRALQSSMDPEFARNLGLWSTPSSAGDDVPPPDPKAMFGSPPKITSRCFTPAKPPPSAAALLSTLPEFGVPEFVYQPPHYSNPKDVPARTRNIAGRDFRIPGQGLEWLKPFDSNFGSGDGRMGSRSRDGLRPTSRFWTPLKPPPHPEDVATWLQDLQRAKGERQGAGLITVPNPRDISQVEGPTPSNKYGFKFDQNKTDSVTHAQQYLTIMSAECHVTTRDLLRPDPAHDPVEFIVFCLQTQNHRFYPDNGHRQGYHVGFLRVDRNFSLRRMGLGHLVEELVPTEEDLFRRFIELVLEFDPDIIVGYELQSESWGYLIERAAKIYDIDLCAEMSRVRDKVGRTRYTREDDNWGFRKASSVHVDGRIVLNIWRLMRAELNLTSYTLENLVYHILHQRIPHFSFAKLTQWYNGPHGLKGRTMVYYWDRVQKNLELLEDTDLIGRTSEFARVFGVEFYSVISRGSQFKVESVMARIAKPRNFVLFSPSRKQVANQRAAEALPLIMEPESAFYPSPLVVLDFQSLYPSVMIAYNYCFSTCLGRTSSIGREHQFGASLLEIAPETVEALRDHINVAPNGLVFVKPHVREGVLRKMLMALLDTRVMVKQSMKLHKLDRALSRLLDARQLGLKYLANVTYGYTSASFSGRMPCVEIADSIVQTGRETLEKAVQLINSTDRWGARVVYGDTDSVFVNLEGCAFKKAFQIGKEIVDEVTRRHPFPVKLKFEKVVYHPCVLLAKKRYVGAMFETPDQPSFAFDAKGIETVRRDGCPAVAKTLEKCLRMLFTSSDLSPIKAYVQRQFRKILEGRVSVQDLIIAKEVKLGNYSENGIPPPGVWLSTRHMEEDPRAEPQYGERVPYCVAHTGPGARLIDCIVSPQELVHNRSIRIHGFYYITKQIIPALSRVFDLMGADVRSWYDEMPKVDRAIRFTSSQASEAPPGRQQRGARKERKTATIDHRLIGPRFRLFLTQTPAFCSDCLSRPQTAGFHLFEEASAAARAYSQLLKICKACTGHRSPDLGADVACDSLDCPIMYSRVRAGLKMHQADKLVSAAKDLRSARLDW